MFLRCYTKIQLRLKINEKIRRKKVYLFEDLGDLSCFLKHEQR